MIVYSQRHMQQDEDIHQGSAFGRHDVSWAGDRFAPLDSLQQHGSFCQAYPMSLTFSLFFSVPRA